MIKVVLDTGVWVSGYSNKHHGSSAKIVESFAKKEIHIITSTVLLNELERVLNYPRIRKNFKFTDKDISDILDNIKETAEIIEPKIKIDRIKEDPDDNRVLECAVKGKVDYIVSSNKHHLVKIKKYKGIPIVLPSDFVEREL